MQEPSTGIDVTLNELIDLRRHVQRSGLLAHTHQLKQSGQRLTRTRGRGIEFDTTREYQAGDDLRSMAWRVTARSLKPHIKVYHEEKERPVWLALDLSPSLYFGTRCMFKSVKIIKQAAQLGWTYLMKGERIGAIIAAGENPQVYQPKANEQHYLAILHALADYSHLQPPFKPQHYLRQLLVDLQQQIRSDNLIVVFSDFADFGEATQKILLHIAQRAQLVLIFIYDPLEAQAPAPNAYLLTDGQHKIAFNMDNEANRLAYQQQFQQKLQLLTDFCRKHQIKLQILRTDDAQEE